MIRTIILAVLVAYASASTIYVQNKCGQDVPVVFRGANDQVYFSGTIGAGQQWSGGFSHSNCGSGCNIGISTGQTLLAEFDDDGSTIWWNLSTDAGYQWPPFRFFSSQPNGPNMYCDNVNCADGHPGDSHINATPEGYDLYVQYCG
eukprot:TRINITY_DN6536_c0_g1_i1.p1 TRINITY_DN6536_c0_g1~~TRINITY_DN6536_c0_g1_i1.p1  ORF type:complete len:146 (-),score=34.84 TRINITY_DN6536_c0_g1_i1:40-477(-)